MLTSQFNADFTIDFTDKDFNIKYCLVNFIIK